MVPSPLRVIHYGLGPIGVEAARVTSRRPGILVVGAVDKDPVKVGRDLAEIADLPGPTGVVVRSSLAELLPVSASVALHTTGSSLAQVKPQLTELLEAGLNVASTCEELSYPVADRAGIGAELASLAKKRGVALLGTGINPGFAMDALPIFLTSVSQEVRSIRVKRVNDAGKRRLPLQLKVGAGLQQEEFQKLVDEGKAGHVGLRESIQMLADAMGWPLEKIEETASGIVARERVATAHLTVEPGQVAGVHQLGVGFMDARPVITLELHIYVGAAPESDEIWIEGRPQLHLRNDNGFPGDITTTAILVNSAHRVAQLPPGLHVMKDLPPAHYRAF